MQEIIKLGMVLVCSVGIASLIAILYSTGLRLWSVSAQDKEGIAHMSSRIGSALCFAGCIAIVIFALWLMIPFFH